MDSGLGHCASTHSQIEGLSPRFQTFVFPPWILIRARVLNCSSTAYGAQHALACKYRHGTQRHVPQATTALASSSALCWPSAKSSGMSASPCAPPSPWGSLCAVPHESSQRYSDGAPRNMRTNGSAALPPSTHMLVLLVLLLAAARRPLPAARRSWLLPGAAAGAAVLGGATAAAAALGVLLRRWGLVWGVLGSGVCWVWGVLGRSWPTLAKLTWPELVFEGSGRVWPKPSFWPIQCGRRGFTRQPENSKRSHFGAPAHQTPPKFHEKAPKRGKKKRNMWRERKKRDFFGPPQFGPHFFKVWPPPKPPSRP